MNQYERENVEKIKKEIREYEEKNGKLHKYMYIIMYNKSQYC